MVFACLLVAGCRPTSAGSDAKASPNPPAAGGSHSGGSAGGLPVGPGPQQVYRVQHQPPVGSCHYRSEGGEPLPDPTCTPGAISPTVTQADLKQTICRKGGYTKKIRPPAAITDREKQLNAASYGYTGRLGDAEYDHLVSLELGGDPNDPRNLWVEEPDPGHRAHGGVNNKKDPVEAQLHTAVCAGRITLAAAQKAIATDWTTALQKLGVS
ncbi:hypothetical protein [Streptomyces sp. NPDC048192]|uniref:hypothetical protein n=1 Tax=Streptomyces sp. NPDC048192 TaxID=3365510 RepID=UPI00371185EA